MANRQDNPADLLSFPALCLAQDASITVVESLHELRQCNALAFFKNRYFNDLILLDSSGARWGVVGAVPAEPLTGMKKWFVKVLNSRLTVELKLVRETESSLETAKERVLAWLGKDPEFWESGRELSEWERMVKGAPDMRQLIRLFA